MKDKLITNKKFYKIYKEDFRSHGAGAWLILMERIRHYEVEGWSNKHDDTHKNGELAIAAACYAVHNTPVQVLTELLTDAWPWDEEWWKPKDQIRNLVRAGALIAAEIDRLNRLDVDERSVASKAK